MASHIPNFKNQLANRFLEDLEADRLILPSLPDVAMRVARVLDNGVSDADAIAEVIQTDPAITAKLIKAANSAMYGRCMPVETCAAAVVRLGSALTHKLVLSLSMRELFTSESPLLQRQMHKLWRHSTEIAALCYVLARRGKRFNPEQAMLVGLLHDIGVVAVLNYIDKFPTEVTREEEIEDAVNSLRARTSSMILERWRFPSEFTVAAFEAEDWMRDTGSMPDYCDLVVTAQLHVLTGEAPQESIPCLSETTAYARLSLGELMPDSRLKFLDEERERIGQAQTLLNL
ncbi:MAG: HDOD domain-containing protein [Gammaproteobacteria bacterium]|nr:HDOD domain-containing protein [Gammaproteobacteria bacterium]